MNDFLWESYRLHNKIICTSIFFKSHISVYDKYFHIILIITGKKGEGKQSEVISRFIFLSLSTEKGLLGILIVSMVHEQNMKQIMQGRKTPVGW